MARSKKIEELPDVEPADGLPDLPEIVPGIAFMEDAQGRKFQIVNDKGNDWDEAATAELFQLYNP